MATVTFTFTLHIVKNAQLSTINKLFILKFTNLHRSNVPVSRPVYDSIPWYIEQTH